MNRGGLLVLMLLLFFPPAGSSAESGGDVPLTLFQKPPKSGQAAQNQVNPSQNEQLRDIYGPVPITAPPPYLLIAGGMGLLLAIAALIWYLKKKKIPAPPPIPPWERALIDLADAKRLLSPERGILYMDRVSQILRDYIESRFAIQSTRQTTREFLQGLTEIGDRSPLQTYKTELKECLERADMAKFAHQLPQLEHLDQMEAAVTSFVKCTEPVQSETPAKRGRS